MLCISNSLWELRPQKLVDINQKCCNTLELLWNSTKFSFQHLRVYSQMMVFGRKKQIFSFFIEFQRNSGTPNASWNTQQVGSTLYQMLKFEGTSPYLNLALLWSKWHNFSKCFCIQKWQIKHTSLLKEVQFCPHSAWVRWSKYTTNIKPSLIPFYWIGPCWIFQYKPFQLQLQLITKFT